jgi:hypothetical protein
VFKRFGFGQRVEALILSQIYPIENYLEDGKVKVITSRSKQNPGKKTRKHISERKFCNALGTAKNRVWSGDGKTSKKAGSQLCRTALWQWCFTRIEVRKRRLKSPLFDSLTEYFDEQKAHKPIKLARSRVCAKAVKMLFYELVKELEKEKTLTE